MEVATHARVPSFPGRTYFLKKWVNPLLSKDYLWLLKSFLRSLFSCLFSVREDYNGWMSCHQTSWVILAALLLQHLLKHCPLDRVAVLGSGFRWPVVCFPSPDAILLQPSQTQLLLPWEPFDYPTKGSLSSLFHKEMIFSFLVLQLSQLTSGEAGSEMATAASLMLVQMDNSICQGGGGL